MRNWVLAVCALATACGDNSRAGEEPADAAPAVPVDGARVDAPHERVADLEEAPEPNGLGVVEDSVTPAGVIRLKASGAYVVHGSLAPHGDAPDVDTYQLQVNAPALLDISVEGLGGASAGFGIGQIESPWPEDWRRFGIDLGSVTSRRRVYVPAGGLYKLAVADVRTMFQLATNDTVTTTGGAATYYLSVAAVAMPAPTPVGVPSTTTGSLAPGDAAFFHATFPVTHPTVVYRVGLAMPSEFAVGAVSMNQQYGTEVAGEPAEIEVRVNNGPYLITVDNVFAVTPGPVAFTLTIQ